MKVSDPVYDSLRNLALVVIPTLGMLYFIVALIGGLPNHWHVVGYLTSFDAVLGVYVAQLAKRHIPPPDGQLIIDKTDPVKDIYRLELSTDVDEIDTRRYVILEVVPVKEESKAT